MHAFRKLALSITHETDHQTRSGIKRRFERDARCAPCSKEGRMSIAALFILISTPPFAITAVAAAIQGDPSHWHATAALGAVMGAVLTAVLVAIVRARDPEYGHLNPVLLVCLNMARALLSVPAALIGLMLLFERYPSIKPALNEHWLLMASAGSIAAIPAFIFMAVTILRLDAIKSRVAGRVIDRVLREERTTTIETTKNGEQ